MNDVLIIIEKRKEGIRDIRHMVCAWSSSNTSVFVSGEMDPKAIIQFRSEKLYIIGRACALGKAIDTEDIFTSIKERNTKGLDRFMRSMNGLFCVVHVDPVNDYIHLISDHFGFYPLYRFQDSSRIIISSSLRVLYRLLRHELHTDTTALANYINNGHLLGGQSWFKELTRLSPASLYCLKDPEVRVEQLYYWTWAQIRKSQESISNLIEKYNHAFKEGISRLQIGSEERTTVSLSGGLDSRWIAQEASRHFNLDTFSFSMGKRGELKLAQRVAAALGIPHHYLEIQKECWLKKRLKLFWEAEGMLHLGHVHEGDVTEGLGKTYSKVFHGFFGGGIYAQGKQCNKPMQDAFARTLFNLDDQDSYAQDAFLNDHGVDAYIIQQRMRNQSAYSIYALSKRMHLVIPFYNMDWMEINYSIDDTLQVHHGFYLAALNADLDKSLLRIPWQRTGISPACIRMNKLYLAAKVPQTKEFLHQYFGRTRHFINYNVYDREVNYWFNYFKKEIASFNFPYEVIGREKKMRLLSLAVWFRMLKEDRYEII